LRFDVGTLLCSSALYGEMWYLVKLDLHVGHFEMLGVSQYLPSRPTLLKATEIEAIERHLSAQTS
jgi:hypothetical protein